MFNFDLSGRSYKEPKNFFDDWFELNLLYLCIAVLLCL